MKALSRLNIGPRLAAAFTLVVALAVVAVGVAVSRMAHMNGQAQGIGSELLPRMRLVNDINDEVAIITRELREALIAADEPAAARTALDGTLAARAKITQLIDQLSARASDPEEQALLVDIKARNTEYDQRQDAFIALVKAGQAREARTALAQQVRPALQPLLKAFEKLTDHEVSLVQAAAHQIDQDYGLARNLMLALTLAMVCCSAGLAWLITRSITQPIGRALQVAEAVAAGDLTSRIESTTRDEVGRLLAALATMNGNLAHLVHAVRRSADSIATGSSQVAIGANDLSQRTEEQAANVQQTAASMEQLGSTVKHNTDNARLAAQIAQSASDVAAQGGQVVRQVVATMDEISSSSQRIADIIGTIDGIAFQTNILALNAAVEAARAGEQGRGFAVVAGEVRSLAQRSGEAAREIKSLIGSSVERVASGAEQVGVAGRTMDAIVNEVMRANALMAEISAASSEQAQGIGQVGAAVTQIDQMTQQNATLVEESAAAAASLQQQAQELARAVAVFRLADALQAPDAAAAVGSGHATHVQEPAVTAGV
jgi:methyl-accepting chemotaxis protein